MSEMKPSELSLCNGLELVVHWLRENNEPAFASIVKQAIPVVESQPDLLEACKSALVVFDGHAELQHSWGADLCRKAIEGSE